MTTLSDAALIDTNVLVYAADISSVHHLACVTLLERASDGSAQLVLSPQILAEFIVVVTNPNGPPVPKDEAYAHVEQLAHTFAMITPTPHVFIRFLELLRATKASGKRVHDILHAATMLENGVSRIYTFDAGFTKITVERP